jgi:hypothetical protein
MGRFKLRMASGTTKETAMNRNKSFAMLAITAALAVTGTTSAAWSFFDGRNDRGGYVKPCSLDGVNPVYHPGIFRNPALAKAVYGFVQGPDHTWHVMSNCRIY